MMVMAGPLHDATMSLEKVLGVGLCHNEQQGRDAHALFVFSLKVLANTILKNPVLHLHQYRFVVVAAGDGAHR